MRPMTIKETVNVLHDLALEKYEQNNHAYYACKTSEIAVNEEGTVTTYAYYLADDMKSSAPEPNVDIEMVVGDFTFGCTYDEYDGYSPWVVKNEGIEMPEDEEIRDALVDVLDELFDRDIEDCQRRCEAPSFEVEWDIEEIAETIERSLESDEYIEIDCVIYPYYGNLQDFAQIHFEDPKAMENIKYTIMTRQEAARYLAENTEIDC